MLPWLSTDFFVIFSIAPLGLTPEGISEKEEINATTD